MRNGSTARTKIPLNIKSSRVNSKWAQMAGTSFPSLADCRKLCVCVCVWVCVCVRVGGAGIRLHLWGVVAGATGQAPQTSSILLYYDTYFKLFLEQF